ncbi:hypothetical protein EMIT0P74_50258 [Pseudomonas sp. IT-P74]
MVRPCGNKAAHVTCICRVLGGLHDFVMQSSGGLAGVFVALRVNGFLMSFLDALRSLAEQVAMSVRLIIASVSTPLMFERVCGGREGRDGGAVHHNNTFKRLGIRRAQHFRGSNDEDATTLGRRCRFGAGDQFYRGQCRQQGSDYRLCRRLVGQCRHDQRGG